MEALEGKSVLATRKRQHRYSRRNHESKSDQLSDLILLHLLLKSSSDADAGICHIAPYMVHVYLSSSLQACKRLLLLSRAQQHAAVNQLPFAKYVRRRNQQNHQPGCNGPHDNKAAEQSSSRGDQSVWEV